MICPRIGPDSQRFGKVFDAEFKKATRGLSAREEPLFRALQQSLVATAAHKFEIEEYHGPNHQVRFRGNGSYARSNARCELADLMVLVYSSALHIARLTYIQAKSERQVTGTSSGPAGKKLTANLEQWHLLAKRPAIQGVGEFAPPPDLLANAKLSSIGTFAFFLQEPGVGFQTYVAAADELSLGGNYTQRQGSLLAVRDHCACGPMPECRSVYGNSPFAAALHGMLIGTPVWPATMQTAPTLRWVARNLYSIIQADPGAESPLLREVARVLGDPPERDDPKPSGGSFGAKSLILLKGSDYGAIGGAN